MIKQTVVLIALASSALVAQEDSLRHRLGFLVDYDGRVVDTFGAKYRVSNSFALTLRFLGGISKSNSDDQQYQPSQQSRSLEIYLGPQVTFLTIYDVSLQVFAKFGYSTGKNERNLQADFSTFTTYTYAIGLGVEYFLTKQFSIAAQHDLEYKVSELTDTFGNSENTINTKRLQVPQGYFVFTLYL